MMDTVKITKAPTGGTINAIISKSAAHRLLIAGFISDLDITECCKGLSDDITATKICLEELCEAKDGTDKICNLHCGMSASTLRFLMPLASALGIECDFVCEGGLEDRPMDPYIEALAKRGCRIEGHNPKHISGKLTSGTFEIPGSISSQFITGLLIALPILEGDSTVVVVGKIESRPYVDLTLQVLDTAGIEIQEEEGEEFSEFFIKGGQKYALPENELQDIEGDWSNVAFWIVMDTMLRIRDGDPEGMARERISFRGLNPISAQGDKAVVPIVDNLLTAKENEMAIELDIDVADTPDLVPALAVLACARPEGSVTHIINAERLRYKETDRLRAITEVLSELGADIKESKDSLTIKSKGRLAGGEVDSFGDHRIAMMAATAACISDGPVTITNAKAVSKSYPNFYKDYQRLGGKLQWL